MARFHAFLAMALSTLPALAFAAPPTRTFGLLGFTCHPKDIVNDRAGRVVTFFTDPRLPSRLLMTYNNAVERPITLFTDNPSVTSMATEAGQEFFIQGKDFGVRLTVNEEPTAGRDTPFVGWYDATVEFPAGGPMASFSAFCATRLK